LLHSARNAIEFQALQLSLDQMPDVPFGPSEWKRVIEVYGLLANVKPQWHRSVKHQDLIIAAAAEAGNVPLVHYDRDFEAIGAITGQPMRWVAPRGSL
jgi:predicted nucleic acid-binding protein